MRHFVSLAVALGLLAGPAHAEIAVMAKGKILHIDRYERVEKNITLFLTGGGEVTVPYDLIQNIVPNEIVEDEGTSPLEVGLFPQLSSVITPAASKYGLDPDLVAAVIWAESSGDPKAMSHRGAQGLMQLMPRTARELGVQDALDPAQNVEGGARYLRRLLDDHEGNLELALAAYNAGPDAVRRYGGVPPYRETQDYVGKVMRVYERTREAAE